MERGEGGDTDFLLCVLAGASPVACLPSFAQEQIHAFALSETALPSAPRAAQTQAHKG